MSVPMNDFIDIIERSVTKDVEGFGTERDVILASVRAEKSYAAMNAMSERDANNATFAVQTAVFKFRRLRGLTVSPAMFIADSAGRYNITAVDEMSGKGMYIVATAKLITASEG